MRVKTLKKLLPKVGVDPARVEMFNLSSAMGPRWAEICNEFTERIRELGPSPVRAALAREGKGGRAS